MKDYLRFGYLLIRRNFYRALFNFFKTRYDQSIMDLACLSENMQVPRIVRQNE